MKELTELQQKMLDLLEDTVQYYSEDPENRRCVLLTEGSKYCFYSPQTAEKSLSQGCAIGRLLDDSLKLELDARTGLCGVSISQIFSHQKWQDLKDKFPKDLLNLPIDFLSMLQDLHDGVFYWDEIGLTEYGQTFVNQIKEYVDELENEETPA